LRISVHDSGYAIACSVEVNHDPFGVTDFALHEIDPGKKTVVTSSVNVTDVMADPLDRVAARLRDPFVPRAGAKTTKAVQERFSRFTVMSPGDQGLLVGTVVDQLLADKYSRALFPPEYAQALKMQTPTFQKFAYASRERFANTLLDVTLSTSSSTSSNICTSTSTSTIEVAI
jgi:hypothetical protein